MATSARSSADLRQIKVKNEKGKCESIIYIGLSRGKEAEVDFMGLRVGMRHIMGRQFDPKTQLGLEFMFTLGYWMAQNIILRPEDNYSRWITTSFSFSNDHRVSLWRFGPTFWPEDSTQTSWTGLYVHIGLVKGPKYNPSARRQL